MFYNDDERRGGSMKDIRYQNTTSSGAVEAYLLRVRLQRELVKSAISGNLLLEKLNEFIKLWLAVLLYIQH